MSWLTGNRHLLHCNDIIWHALNHHLQFSNTRHFHQSPTFYQLSTATFCPWVIHLIFLLLESVLTLAMSFLVQYFLFLNQQDLILSSCSSRSWPNSFALPIALSIFSVSNCNPILNFPIIPLWRLIKIVTNRAASKVILLGDFSLHVHVHPIQCIGL